MATSAKAFEPVTISGLGPRLCDYLAVSAAVITGHLGPISQPYQVATVMEAGGTGQATAGLFLGVEIASYAAALMLAARFVGVVSLRALAFNGVAVSLIAFILAQLTGTLIAVALARWLWSSPAPATRPGPH